MTRASVRDDALDDDVRVERLVEAGRLRARRGVADEDHRAVVGAQAALGRQAAQPVDAVVAERVVGPFGGGLERVRDAVGHPREGRRVVEVGDGDVGVAGHDGRAVRLHLAQQVDRAGRVRAVEDEVAGDGDEVRARTAWTALRTASSATALPWTSDRIAKRVIEARLRRGMMKLIRTPRRRPRRRRSRRRGRGRTARRASPS